MDLVKASGISRGSGLTFLDPFQVITLGYAIALASLRI
jgi:hypothetical protein